MKKKNICIVTAARSEWGVLRPLAELIKADTSYNLLIFATGTHYCSEFGNTYQEIEEAGIPISEKIQCVTEGDTPHDITNTRKTLICCIP